MNTLQRVRGARRREMATIDKERLPVSLVYAGPVATEATEKVDEPDRPFARQPLEKTNVLCARLIHEVKSGPIRKVAWRQAPQPRCQTRAQRARFAQGDLHDIEAPSRHIS